MDHNLFRYKLPSWLFGGGLEAECKTVLKVPPLNSPFIVSKNSILVNFWPNIFYNSLFALKVIKSQGIESRPQQFIIIAPV